MKFRVVAIIGLSLFAGACATPAEVKNMVVDTPRNIEPKDPALKHGMCVTSVEGGEETNPLWTSQVDNASFKAALEGSLKAQMLLAEPPANCSFSLRAHLLGLNQPSFGFNMTVGSNVNYEVTKSGSDIVYLAHSQSASYTATVGQAFAGVERLRLANEGSIKENIRQFISALLRHTPG